MLQHKQRLRYVDCMEKGEAKHSNYNTSERNQRLYHMCVRMRPFTGVVPTFLDPVVMMRNRHLLRMSLRTDLWIAKQSTNTRAPKDT
jgi:hypothetical protein